MHLEDVYFFILLIGILSENMMNNFSVYFDFLKSQIGFP